jgi:hypothetical protein
MPKQLHLMSKIYLTQEAFYNGLNAILSKEIFLKHKKLQEVKTYFLGVDIFDFRLLQHQLGIAFDCLKRDFHNSESPIRASNKAQKDMLRYIKAGADDESTTIYEMKRSCTEDMLLKVKAIYDPLKEGIKKLENQKEMIRMTLQSQYNKENKTTEKTIAKEKILEIINNMIEEVLDEKNLANRLKQILDIIFIQSTLLFVEHRPENSFFFTYYIEVFAQKAIVLFIENDFKEKSFHNCETIIRLLEHNKKGSPELPVVMIHNAIIKSKKESLNQYRVVMLEMLLSENCEKKTRCKERLRELDSGDLLDLYYVYTTYFLAIFFDIILYSFCDLELQFLTKEAIVFITFFIVLTLLSAFNIDDYMESVSQIVNPALTSPSQVKFCFKPSGQEYQHKMEALVLLTYLGPCDLLLATSVFFKKIFDFLSGDLSLSRIFTIENCYQFIARDLLCNYSRKYLLASLTLTMILSKNRQHYQNNNEREYRKEQLLFEDEVGGKYKLIKKAETPLQYGKDDTYLRFT